MEATELIEGVEIIFGLVFRALILLGLIFNDPPMLMLTVASVDRRQSPTVHSNFRENQKRLTEFPLFLILF